MNKKPYDHTKDFLFVPPSVVRTSRVRVSEKNVDLVGEFFRAVAMRSGSSKISVFTEISAYNGEIRNTWTEVLHSDLTVEKGVYFKYIHRLGVSERVILEKDGKDAREQRIYAISG